LWIAEEGEDFLESLNISTDNIHVGYLNVVNDINSDILDEPLSWFTPHYITQLEPPMMDITAEEAAQEASAVFSQYSCFTYTPQNIVAFDAEAEGESGYYYIKLQPVYNGILVLDKYVAGSTEYSKSIAISAAMSAKGLFSFQGNLLYKEIERAEVEQRLSLKRAVEKMAEDFPIYAIGETVTVTNICAAYCFQASVADGTDTLVPGWAFACIDSAEDSSGIKQQYTCFYDFETGSLRMM